MNVEEAKVILFREKISERTPFGRPINKTALESIASTLEDEKNFGNNVIQCKSCGFVISILLTENGCPNCGIEELETKIVT
jgi:rubrerythrin